MNIFKGRWPQFKQELPTILYLLIIQIWLNFNCPFVRWFPYPWNLIVASALCVICAFLYIYNFVFPEKYAPLVNLEFLDDFPNPTFFKKLFWAWKLFVATVVYLFMWKKDYWHMSFAWYLLCYLHYIVTIFLMYKAIKRYQNNFSNLSNNHFEQRAKM